MSENSLWQKRIIIVLLTIIIVGSSYFVWQYFERTTLITGESQSQAETPQGVMEAAHNAQVKLYQDQLEAAAKEIAALKNRAPDTIIKTVPVEVIKTVEKEREQRGADFVVMTDPKQPDKKVDLEEVAKLPAATPVTLNQYNVFAYKKIVRGITVYPQFNGIKPSGISEFAIDINRKISNDGKYIGIVSGYDFDNKKVKAGIRFTY